MITVCVMAAFAGGQNTSTELPANCSAYETIPLPEEAEKVPVPKVAPACASYRSYRGVGRPVDYSNARACAWQERLAQKAGLGQNQKEPTAWVVGGSLILADIYFNGAGVERNVPLAMRFACEFEEGTAMLARPEIAKFKASRARSPFEFCDYAASTFTMNFCNGYASEIKDDRRSRYFDSLKASMTVEQRAAFEKLLAAESAYIETHANEVDQGGSIRVIRTIGSQQILKDLFHTELVHFERKDWPKLSETQITTADDLLRREYSQKLAQLHARPKDDLYEGEVNTSDVSSVQKVWERYRDAWAAFARLRYPAAAPAIQAQIALDRYRLLKTIE